MTYLAYVLASHDDETTKLQLNQIADKPEVGFCYVENTTSGALKVLERPRFGELYKFLRRGDTLIVPTLEHLGSSVAEFAEIFRALKRKGANVISMRESFDLSSETGEVAFELFTTLVDLEVTIRGTGQVVNRKSTP